MHYHVVQITMRVLHFTQVALVVVISTKTLHEITLVKATMVKAGTTWYKAY